jgi:hypothetical protein
MARVQRLPRPSLKTIFAHMKTFIVIALLACISVACVFGQAEQVKKKAKDLKRSIETQQTNQIKGATNAPVRR